MKYFGFDIAIMELCFELCFISFQLVLMIIIWLYFIVKVYNNFLKIIFAKYCTFCIEQCENNFLHTIFWKRIMTTIRIKCEHTI